VFKSQKLTESISWRYIIWYYMQIFNVAWNPTGSDRVWHMTLKPKW